MVRETTDEISTTTSIPNPSGVIENNDVAAVRRPIPGSQNRAGTADSADLKSATISACQQAAVGNPQSAHHAGPGFVHDAFAPVSGQLGYRMPPKGCLGWMH